MHREDRGKSEGRVREERVEKPFQKFFPTLSSLCLSLRLPSLFPGAVACTGRTEGRERHRNREERVKKLFQDLFPTLSSLCLSLFLPSLFPRVL
jgi:hypothetical protein